jgi:hypothetical protein
MLVTHSAAAHLPWCWQCIICSSSQQPPHQQIPARDVGGGEGRCVEQHHSPHCPRVVRCEVGCKETACSNNSSKESDMFTLSTGAGSFTEVTVEDGLDQALVVLC